MEEMNLKKMMKGLAAVDDMTWGMYAFSRDALRDKMDCGQKEETIEESICYGYETADKITNQMGASNLREITGKLGLRVEYLDKGQIADRVLFALFTPPDLIQIMGKPIDKAVKGGSLDGFTTREQLEDLILGHEIYHYLEEEHDGIYTRTERICLWKILDFENRFTIRALSEIAGTYFSKKLNDFPYSLFALDILLYCNYNSKTAPNMYRKVAEI